MYRPHNDIREDIQGGIGFSAAPQAALKNRRVGDRTIFYPDSSYPSIVRRLPFTSQRKSEGRVTIEIMVDFSAACY